MGVVRQTQTIWFIRTKDLVLKEQTIIDFLRDLQNRIIITSNQVIPNTPKITLLINKSYAYVDSRRYPSMVSLCK